MNSDTKLFGGIILVTVALIIGAAFFFSRPPSQNDEGVDPAILVKSESHSIASPSATITLVEFGDYQCPACSAYHPIVKQLTSTYKDSLKFVYRHFPLTMHANAKPASYAAEAAAKQGKFWEMHAKLFENQKDWSTGENTKQLFEDYAKELGLNLEQFKKDIDSSDVKKRVEDDYNDGIVLGVNSTPSFFLNNKRIINPRTPEDFETLIKAALLNAPSPSISASEDFHSHANIRVILDGKPFDFSKDLYQSLEGKELNEFVHFHDGVGDVVHFHKKDMSLLDLFGSLKMKISKSNQDSSVGQFDDDKGGIYQVRMYVNGVENTQYESYKPQDLDRILITNATDESMRKSQLSTVADTACIYSEKCPERGTPPTEACVGGLGTDCK